MNAEGGSLGEGVQEVRGCIGTGPFETLRNLCALRGLNNFYREGRRVCAKARKGCNGKLIFALQTMESVAAIYER